MTQEEILEYNKRCAEFLGYKLITPDNRKNPERWSSSYWEHPSKSNTAPLGRILGQDEYLEFHSDLNWIMEVADEIFAQGFRKYSYTHEEHSRCVFTDMAISYQKHEFGGGNIVADSGKCTTEKEAVVQAINQFLIFYNENNK